MTFFTIVSRGLLRRPVRTGLTLVGISIGIAAVVALVGISSGYEKSVGKQLDVIGVDLVVSNMGGGFMPKVYDASLEGQIAKLPRVAQTSSVLMQMLSVEDAPMVMVSGREWGGFTWEKLKLLDGRLPLDANEKAVVLGRLAADVLKKKVGDTVQIEADELTVGGDRRWPGSGRERSDHSFPPGPAGRHGQRRQSELHRRPCHPEHEQGPGGLSFVLK
jgi:putative ABC transport system permease protein